MADKDFVVKNGLRTVGNTIVANSSQISLNSNVVVDNSASFTANGSSGSAGQILASNGTGIYWTTPTTLSVNQAAQYSWTNTHSFSNTVTFNGNAAISTLSANGGFGSAGQVLISGGTSSNAYWAATPVNVAATYSWTNVHTFSNTLTITGLGGRLFLDGIPITANGSNGTSGQVLASNGSTGSPYWVTPGTGTVSQVNTGVGLTGGPVSTTGTISVNPNTGIVANSTGVFVSNTYVNTSADFTINGQLTFSNVVTFNANAALSRISANGSFGTAGHALFSGGGTTNNYFSNVVTSVSVTAGQIAATYSGANPTLGLATTAVTPGSYTLTSITVDAYGRVTAASNGSAGAAGVTSVANGDLMLVTGTGSGPYTGAVTVSHANSGVTSGSYTAHGFTVDSRGHITATAAFRSASTTQQGMVQLSDSTSTTSSTLAATSTAVKSAYDLAASKGSGTVTSIATSGGIQGGTITSSGTISLTGSYSGTWSVSGAITATGDITAYSSDKRLKTNIASIENPIDKIKSIRGVTYNWNDLANSFGFDTDEPQVGVIAQEVQAVLPEVIKLAPFDRADKEDAKTSLSGENYLTVQYDKIVPLLIEAIKEQQKQIEQLKAKIG